MVDPYPPTALPPGATRVFGPGDWNGTTVAEPDKHRTGRRVLTLALTVAVAVLTVVVVHEVTHPVRLAPPIGTAVVVPGQRTNVLPDPDFLTACSSSTYDDSATCVDTTVQAIDHARAEEGVAPLVLPSNWYQLTPAEQLFVATNLERTARNFLPVSGLSDSLDAIAGRAANDGTDPMLEAGGSISTVAGNWIDGYSNPLEALYMWVYDDGLGSSNVDCTRRNLTGCWGHRTNILLPLACTACASGAAYAPSDHGGEPLSYAEVIVESLTPMPYTFSWSQEQPYLR